MAGCVLRRDWRDIIRRVLGPHILLLNLTTSEEAREKRLLQRHQGDQREVRWLKVRLRKSCKKFIKKKFQHSFHEIEPKIESKKLQSVGSVCEPVEMDEENVVELVVEEDMTREQILMMVMDTILQNEKKF